MVDRGEVALFLGAGASASFGYPTTDQIFGKIWDHLKKADGSSASRRIAAQAKLEGEIGSALDLGSLHPGDPFTKGLIERSNADLALIRKGWKAELKKGLQHLMPGLGRADARLPSIIDVLSIVDHFLAAREVAAPVFQPRFLEDLRVRLEYSILQVLSRPRLDMLHDDDITALQRFARWICPAGSPQASPIRPVTLVSTNYDILLEMAIYGPSGIIPRERLHEEIDFGFPWREPNSKYGDGIVRNTPGAPLARILKLHGSLNWLRCWLCGHTYIQPSGEIFDLSFREGLTTWNCCHCGHGALRPVIVAPSSVRQINDPNLLMIWQRALEAFRTARHWYIIGYSLPPEDLAIRSILMRAYRGRNASTRPKIVVIGWDGLLDPSREPDKLAHEGRYRLLFGDDCEFSYHGLKGFITETIPTISLT